VIKIVAQFRGYFKESLPDCRKDLRIENFLFFDLLVEHFDYMSSKKPKNTDFTPHEEQKIKWLDNLI
jgi:hypothetical protein